jgi:HemY protein
MRPDHMESRLLLARQAIKTRRWKEARDALEPLATAVPMPRVCALMAEIEQGESGNIGAAREWLARAVSAPPESPWLRTEFNLSTEEWATLARRVALDGDWPPPPESARSDKGGIDVAPFAEALRSVTTVSEPGEQEADRTRPVVIVTPPPADHVSEGEVLHLPEDVGKTAALAEGGGVIPLRPVREVRRAAEDAEPAPEEEAKKNAAPAKVEPSPEDAARNLGKSSDAEAPQQPDDPGPEYGKDVKKGDIPGW